MKLIHRLLQASFYSMSYTVETSTLSRRNSNTLKSSTQLIYTEVSQSATQCELLDEKIVPTSMVRGRGRCISVIVRYEIYYRATAPQRIDKCSQQLFNQPLALSKLISTASNAADLDDAEVCKNVDDVSWKRRWQMAHEIIDYNLRSICRARISPKRTDEIEARIWVEI